MTVAVYYIDKAVCLTEADALMKPQYWLMSISSFESLFLLVNVGCCYNNTYIFVGSFVLACVYLVDIFAGVAMACQLCLYDIRSFFLGLIVFIALLFSAYRNFILIDDFYKKRQRLRVNLNEGSVQKLQKLNQDVEEVYVSWRS